MREKVKVFDPLNLCSTKTLPYTVFDLFLGTNGELWPKTVLLIKWLQAPQSVLQRAAKGNSGAEDLHVAGMYSTDLLKAKALQGQASLTTCCAM